MANGKAGRPKGSHDSMPELRGALKRCLVLMAESGLPLSTVWENLFKTDPAKAIQLAIACHPKEMSIDIDQQVSIDTNRLDKQTLDQVIAARRNGTTSEDKSVH